MKNFIQIPARTLLLIAVIFSFLSAKSQQSLIQVTSWNWNTYVHLPADYNSNPAKVYPTIIFFPGIGEIGTDASLVIENGPGAYLAQGWDGNISIGTKDSVEFIVISVQPVQSWPFNVQTDAAIQQLKSLYRIDPSKLYLTGLSMGGWMCSQYVTGDAYGGPYTYASQVAAEVNVEGVAINVAAPTLILWDNFAKSGGRLACFEQLNDYRQMQNYVTQMDSIKTNSALYTQTDFGDGSHCCWASFYGGEGTQPSNFMLDGISKNIYQWMARQSLTVQSSGAPSISSATTASGTVNAAFSYTITASNTPTSYAATGLPAGLTINTSTGVISGIPTAAGISNVMLSAINAKGTGTATLVITIKPLAPVISSATTASGTVGTAFSYTITASNTPTSYAATGLPAGIAVNTSTGVISGTPTTAGTSSVTISAINSGGTGTKTLTVIINAAAPVISSATTASGTVGTAFSYTITSSNTPTSYAASGLPAGLTVNTSTGVISGTPTTAGTSSVTISAINSGGTGTKTLTVTINAAAPVISSAATSSGTVGTAFSYTITASNTPTSYAATSLPAGLTVNTSTGVISGTPTTTGTSSVTISAINSGGTGTKTLTVTINAAAPVISSATTASGTVGAAFSYTITASNTPTSYAVTGLPAGLTINTSTGVISGTPTTAGTSNVTLSAINAKGTGTATLVITIKPLAPVISSAATASGTVGTAFSYTITASNTPTSYTATGLPAGLTVNTSTGVISGTPTTVGTSNVTISAINSGGTGTKTLTVTINAAAPVISSATTASGTVGTAFSYTITASNTPTSYAASGLPAGLTVNTSTGVISGTPTTTGTSSVTISAINTGGTGTKTLTVTINAAVRPNPIANAGINQTITLPTNSVTLNGSGTDVNGTISSYKWAKVSGPATGTITNTASAVTTVTSLTQGIYQFELTVTDISGAFGKDTVQITVNASSTTSTNQLPASDTATWSLTSDKTVITGGPGINAGSMLPGADFPNPGAENTNGYKCVISSGDWPTAPGNGYNIDFPISPGSGANLNITGLTFTSVISGSSGNTMFSLAYQVDGAGSWIAFGSAQTALSGGTRSVDFGTLNQLLSSGHTYTIRLYVYSSIATTSNSRNVYIKDVVFKATASAASQSRPAILNQMLSANSIELNIYPNPVHDNLLARINAYPVNQKLLITLTDMGGRILYKKEIAAIQQTTDIRISMSQFEDGIYILHVIAGEKNITKEVIKKLQN